MTADEAARRLGVSRSTLQRLIKDHELTPINPPSPRLLRPRRLLFSRADVERLANAPPPTPKPRKKRQTVAPLLTYTSAPQYHIAAEDVPPYTAAPRRPRAEG